MDREERAAEIVGAWQQERDRGVASPPEEVLRRHPDLAVELREAFAALDLLDHACAPTVSGPAPSPSPDAARKEEVPRPDRIGDFRILHEIGRGGMGVVYEAEQVSMRRPVALKVLYPSVTMNSKAVERFRREAQATGRLHHTNIVQVHAMGSDAGQWYYAMEHVQGRALSDILDDLRRLKGGGARVEGKASSSVSLGALSTSTGRREEYARIARMFAGVAEALATAHDAGVVHRDVKPSNLMLDETATLKILDFGLASIQEEPHGVTVTGDILGTPAYMSPEQARAKPVDGRSDVYSLGATLYEVLTLRPPVRGRDLADTIHQVLTREPVRPRRLDPRIPRDLETIVLKTLEKEPGRRYASAADLARDLRAFAEGFAIAARRVGPLGRVWRHARRHPARTSLAAGAAVAISVAIALGVSAARAVAERDRETARRWDLEYRTLLTRVTMGVRANENDVLGAAPDPYARAIALAPERPEAWYQRAFHRRVALLDDRLADLEAARARGLPVAQYRLARSLVLRWGGRREEALAEEALATDAPTSNLEALTLRASIAMADGRGTEAQQILDRVIGAALPDDDVLHGALVQRSDLRARGGDYDGALADLLAVRVHVAADTPLPVQDARITWLWVRLGRPEAAQRHLDQLLAAYEKRADARAYLDLGQELLERGCTPFWRQTREAGLRRHPDNVRMQLARCIELSPADQLAAVERILREHPDDDRDLIGMWKADALLGVNRVEEAAAIVDGLVRKYGPTESLVRSQVIVLRRLGRFEEAEAVYRDALSKTPVSKEIAASYAQFLSAHDRPQEALAVIERALGMDRSDVRLNDAYAGALSAVGRTAEALEAARKTMLLGSDWVGYAPYFLYPPGAVRVLANENAAEVVSLLERAVRDHPENADARTTLAQALARSGRPADALDILDRRPSLEFTPFVAYARIEPLNVLGRMADLVEAADAFIRLKPEDASGYWYKGVALLNLGRAADAIPMLERFLALAAAGPSKRVPPSGEDLITFPVVPIQPGMVAYGHCLLGRALRFTGDPKRALTEVDTALSLVPRNLKERVSMLQGRAEALAMLEQREEAVATIMQAIDLQPDFPGVYLTQSNVLRRFGDYVGSEAAMRKAIRVAGPEQASADCLGALATDLLNLDRLSEAATEADRAVEMGDRRSMLVACVARSLDPNPREGSVARARELAEKALAQKLDFGWQAMGAALAAAGEWKEAAEALVKALAGPRAARDFLSQVLLARAYLHLGQVKDAGDVMKAIRAARGWPAHVSLLEHRVMDEVGRELKAAVTGVPK